MNTVFEIFLTITFSHVEMHIFNHFTHFSTMFELRGLWILNTTLSKKHTKPTQMISDNPPFHFGELVLHLF